MFHIYVSRLQVHLLDLHQLKIIISAFLLGSTVDSLYYKAGFFAHSKNYQNVRAFFMLLLSYDKRLCEIFAAAECRSNETFESPHDELLYTLKQFHL
jgi:hypothetical protein